MTLLFRRPIWFDQAACRGIGPGVFFRANGGLRGPCPGRSTALALCDACPVAWDCLADALDRGEQDGIWGGFDLGEEQKARWRREQRARAERLRSQRDHEEEGAA